MRKVIFIFCLNLAALFANETKIDALQIQKAYYESQNIWLLSLQTYKDYTKSYQELEILQNRLNFEIANNNTEEAVKLKEETGALKNNLKLQGYENRQPLYKIFEPFESVLEQLNDTKISIFSLLLSNIENEMEQLDSTVKNYYKEYENALNIINVLENNGLSLANDKRVLQISLNTLEKIHQNVFWQYEAYNKKISHFKSEELGKLLYILLSVVIIFIITNAVKLFFKRKHDKSEEYDQRYFMIKKVLNILFAIVAILIFAFMYIENMAQVLAVFGVIGAGLTVVMKEWVLSYVGWFVLITSNSIQIGDRIKISKDGRSIIGDVINISLTKLTLYENITNDALTEHKKAGRVIFVPNYYLIMGEVYNYTHLSLKTILDLVEIRMTFESNLQKAEKIGLESAELVTNRFTEMAKKQYDALKSHYTLRNMTQYPKVFFYPSAHGNGVVMGVWYVSPYREILKHKSEVMKEIVNRILQEEDIHLLYSAQSVFLENDIGKM
ncbi:MAG: mechanosensitive ion channel family protein [Campylobacteraceae bacterium]|jgi:small-conductance mechanosensitive channel|nr:mechanosensitive ion channel family protein [Campylobacteraceae bacterium]